MKMVVQRVRRARVTVAGEVVGAIGPGMLIFLGIARDDRDEDVCAAAAKVVALRLFEDAQGKMNVSAWESGAEFLVVSQFTLLGDCAKGRRPSFDAAAPPEQAEALYRRFVEALADQGVRVATGRFRAMMDVELVNDGPVTFILETPAPARRGGD